MSSVTIQVPARQYWVDTGVDVVAGQTVGFHARGEWLDWFIPCGPNGYDRPYLAPLKSRRRVPSAPWFHLCAALDKDEATAVAIGASASHPFTRAGRVFVFANDVPFAYWNNAGCVELTLESQGP